MPLTERPRVLCVDDEPNVLAALDRTLSERFDVCTAVSGERALVLIAAGPPFTVVISDMRMPGMDGAAFLARVRGRAPDTVRILLTGQADIGSAIAAINEGAIFRYLSKPCPHEELMAALDQAVAHHWFVQSEREMLEAALAGAVLAGDAASEAGVVPVDALVRTLTQMVALVAPWAAQRAAFAEACVGHALSVLNWPDAWMHRAAAALSQIGCIGFRLDALERAASQRTLGAADAEAMARHPEIAWRLLSDVSRLERVAAIIRYQAVAPPHGTDREVVRGAQLLRAALMLEQLTLRGTEPDAATAALRRMGAFDEPVIDAVAGFRCEFSEQRAAMIELLEPGCILDEDVRTTNGLLLLSRGHELTVASILALQRMRARGAVEEPIRIRSRPSEARAGA
jgi:response regulator RpfG family c-di-GMP phosphodiesterase